MSNGNRGGYQGGGYPDEPNPPPGYGGRYGSRYDVGQGSSHSTGHSTGLGDDYDDDFEGYEDEGEDEGRSRVLIYFLAGLIVVGGLGALAYYAYERGAASTSTAPVIIQAEEGEVKIAPEDPGGMQVPHQDKLVYDRLEGGTSEEEDAGPGERLLPPAEEPLPALRGRQGTDKIASGAKSEALTATPPADVDQPKTAAPKAQVPAPKAEAAPQTPGLSSSSASSSYVVQIAALRDEAAARALFTQLSQKYSDLLSGLSPDIERADLGDKGIYYRLRLAPFASQGAAQKLCASLKGRGQDCMVKAG